MIRNFFVIMSNIPVIAQLVARFQDFEKEVKEPTIEGFSYWLQQQKKVPNLKKHLQTGGDDNYANEGIKELDSAIGILLGILNKYAKNYSKIALDNLPLNTIDEFGYLAHLSTHQKITKTELISQGLDGKTTGTDIIRRLVKNGLAKEIINPKDKRSKLLQITEKGKKIIYHAYVKMSAVSLKVTGNLSKAEKKQLLQLLSKLELYHKYNEKSITTELELLNSCR
jgi:DNA-binding MarR family transcriptional regulator